MKSLSSAPGPDGLVFFMLFLLQGCLINKGLSQCAPTVVPPSGPPSGIVHVQVLSVEPNSDMEGDDDYVPFYDNHADIYGKVTIDGEAFDLPEIEDSDFPHWDIVFEKQVTTNPIKIRIKIQEDDWGLTGNNDLVDINPDANSSALELSFDLCEMTIKTSSAQYPAQGIITIDAGNGINQATIRLKIETADGRPLSTNDVALVETDLVQVIFQTHKLIGGKPTIVMARVANNYSTSITTNVRVTVVGPGVNRNDIFPMTIGAGEVKKEYYYLNDPIRFDDNIASQPAYMTVRVEDVGNQNLDPKNCVRINDGTPGRLEWKVVHTPRRYNILWAKVGTLLDGFNFASDEQLKSNKQLGSAYIDAVFPLNNPYHHKTNIGILPPLTAATDFLTTILSVFGIPADNVTPYALIFELNGVANLVHCDRLMGVLPNKDWFSRFSYSWLDEVTGMSLGEFAPRAVIFLPQYGDPSNLGPAMTLPAHELGHTFGLSVDPSLKDSWVCNVDWPILGHSACGFVGGFDEYKSSTHPEGNPADGFWIKQGNEPNELSALINSEQCGSHCFMAGSSANSHLDWTNLNKWIDEADYDHLVSKLQNKPDPELIYISGMISWNDQLFFGSIQHMDQGVPDRDTSFGAYAIQFLNSTGKKISEVGLPVNWNSSDFSSHPRPITFFGLNVEFPSTARQLQVVNRLSGKILGTKKISINKPVVKLKPIPSQSMNRSGSLEMVWNAKDRDGDKLQYFTMARPDKEEGWFPVAFWQEAKKISLPLKEFEPGAYIFKIVASDGIHVSSSNELTVNIKD